MIAKCGLVVWISCRARAAPPPGQAASGSMCSTAAWLRPERILCTDCTVAAAPGGLSQVHRQIGVKGKMWRMCAIDKQFGAVAAAQCGERRRLSPGGAVIRWDAVPRAPWRHFPPTPAPPHRHLTRARRRSGSSQRGSSQIGRAPTCTRPGEHGLVGIACHQNRLAGTQCRQRDGDVAGRRALHQDETLPDTPRVGDQIVRRRESAPRGSAGCRCRAGCSGPMAAMCSRNHGSSARPPL